MSERPTDWVRLACSECDCDDYDGITEADLEALVSWEPWEDVVQVQSWEQSIEAYWPPSAAPPDFDATAWYTHIGLCPDCREAMNGTYAMRALFPETHDA